MFELMNLKEDFDANRELGASTASLDRHKDEILRLQQYLEQNPPLESIKGFVQGILNNW